MLQQRQETPLDFVVPYDQIRYKGYRYGGRIQFANGGRLSFAEGPEDPKKRATLKKNWYWWRHRWWTSNRIN